MHQKMKDRIDDIEVKLFFAFSEAERDVEAARAVGASQDTLNALREKEVLAKHRYKTYSEWRSDEAA